MYKLILVTLLLLAPAAFAQNTYSPDYCGFEVTFPEKPYTERKCDDRQDRCYDLISYTKNFGPDASVHVEIICNPVDAEVYGHYSEDVMAATLKAMRDKDTIQTYETSASKTDTYKQANLIGEGRRGVTPSLYIAQLWIDRKSALSVEAELIGEALTESDQLFSDILKSIQPVSSDIEQ